MLAKPPGKGYNKSNYDGLVYILRKKVNLLQRVNHNYPISKTPYANLAKTTAVNQDPKVSIPKNKSEPPSPSYIMNLLGEPAVIKTANGYYGPLPSDGKAATTCKAISLDNATAANLRKILRSTATVQKCEWHISIDVDGQAQKFPQQRSGVFLLVPRAVALAAQNIGRSAADLVFPTATTKRDDGMLVVNYLGALGK